ncbi:MAG: bifunctional folylpolyglutamate synthase/dihydrofolate synthase, partial [Nitrosospira sp.]|nr:bifunctional folylpolyglutamate synthase/dihydrofolate synthase [Nitrosospira sp.]
FDHMDYLGDTREKIGLEKAGIFRSGRAAICSEPDIPATVRHHAKAVRAHLMHIGEHFGHSANPVDATLWSYWGPGGKRHALPYPALRGACQLHNASACLAALDAVKDRLPVTMSDVRQGLLDVALPGRFQVLPGRPATVLDVAHNPHAAHALAIDLGGMGRYRKTYAVFAMLRDKDIAGVARALAAKVDMWLTAGIDAPRGASADETAQALEAAGISRTEETVRTFPNPAMAYAYACERAAENDRICVFGSFHTVAEVLRYRNTVEHG